MGSTIYIIMRYCLVCPFVCLFVRHMCVRAYLFEPNFSLFHHVKISWISGILFRNRGILCSNRGILFRNRGILFRNRGILCRNHGILFKNRGILKSRRRRLLTRVIMIITYVQKKLSNTIIEDLKEIP